MLELDLHRPTRIDQVVLQEDIAQGERIRTYVVEGFDGLGWRPLCEGLSVGHKRIERIQAATVSRVRCRVTSAVGTPQLRSFRVF